MPNIKPISDLRNYASVLETVEVGKPLYLTKNGRGMYTVMDMKEQEEQQKKAELYDQMQTKLKEKYPEKEKVGFLLKKQRRC